MERDDWRCKECGDTETLLHVHHLMYHRGKDPWDIDNRWLVTLCRVCHEKLKDDPKPQAPVNPDMALEEYDGTCPRCGGGDMKDKGTYDKCKVCGSEVGWMGVRITTHPFRRLGRHGG